MLSGVVRAGARSVARPLAQRSTRGLRWSVEREPHPEIPRAAQIIREVRGRAAALDAAHPPPRAG